MYPNSQLVQVGQNFVIKDLEYIPLKNHMPMYGRPYVINATGNAIDIACDRVESNRAGKITSDILSGIAGELIQPSATVLPCIVDNNWVSTKRFIFRLTVSYIDSVEGVEVVNYIQGYTDHDGITMSGHADNRMVHYINSIIETVVCTYNTPMGMSRTEKLHRIYNVMTNLGTYGSFYTQRPGDVIAEMNGQVMSEVIRTSEVEQISRINLEGYISPFKNNVVTSVADNNIPSAYISRILNAGVMIHREGDVFLDHNHRSSWSDNNRYGYDTSTTVSNINTNEIAPEYGLSENRFIRFLSHRSGYKSVVGSFSLGDILAVDPSVYDRFNYYAVNNTMVDPTMAATPEVGEYWHGQDIVTIKAYSILEASTSLALRYGFDKISFIATNKSNQVGGVEVFILNYKSKMTGLSENGVYQLLEIFKTKFVSEIYLNETTGGVAPCHLEIHVNLLGTSKLCIEYHSYPATWYTAPTIANSLYSPMLNIDQKGLEFSAINARDLIDRVINNSYSVIPTYP